MTNDESGNNLSPTILSLLRPCKPLHRDCMIVIKHVLRYINNYMFLEIKEQCWIINIVLSGVCYHLVYKYYLHDFSKV